MKNIDNGGSAFPSHGTMGEVCQTGMTLRDYFAAKALNGMLSRDSYQGGWSPKEDPQQCGVKRVARFAYEYADAMLAERNKS